MNRRNKNRSKNRQATEDNLMKEEESYGGA
jgi:hypothetical protein